MASTISQSASVVYMIRPIAPKQKPEEVQELALKEFDNYVEILKSKGVEVMVFEDTYEPHTPDSIFPNDWCSYHEDGTVAVYPMFAKNRRQERREDIIEDLQKKYNFKVTRKVDFTAMENDGKFLEGAGVMVFDYPNKVVYCSISNRAHKEVIEKYAAELGYKAVTWKCVDDKGLEIYHTTVVLALGEKFAILVEDSVADPQEKEVLIKTLEETGHEVIGITFEQMYAYAANALEVANSKGEKFLSMSRRANESLTPVQKQKIAKYAELLSVPLDVIEDNGGGSARCMIGDMRLPKNL